MNDTGVKAALAAMGELIRNSVPDWVDAMRKRWLLAVGLIVLVDALTTLLRWRGVAAAPAASGFAVTAGTLVLLTFIFADAMRLMDPSYGITLSRFMRLVGIALLVGLIYLLALIPTFVFGAIHQTALSYVFVYAAAFVMGARFCLTFFLTEQSARPIRYSWLLTAGATFLPSIVPVAISAAPGGLLELLLPGTLAQASIVLGVLHSTLQIGLLFINTAWVYPLTVRWLPVCERFHASDASPV
jgi:hypothetical protein